MSLTSTATNVTIDQSYIAAMSVILVGGLRSDHTFLFTDTVQFFSPTQARYILSDFISNFTVFQLQQLFPNTFAGLPSGSLAAINPLHFSSLLIQQVTTFTNLTILNVLTCNQLSNTTELQIQALNSYQYAAYATRAGSCGFTPYNPTTTTTTTTATTTETITTTATLTSTSTTASSTTTTSTTGHKGLSGGDVAGIVISVLFAFFLVTGLVIYFYGGKILRTLKLRRNEDEENRLL